MKNYTISVLTLFIFLTELSVAQSERSTVYPDIVPGAKLEILSVPGFRSEKDCKPKCKVTHRVSYDQEIIATGGRKVTSFEDDEGDTVLEEYIEVETRVGLLVYKGWVPADLTSHESPAAEPTVDADIKDQAANWHDRKRPQKIRSPGGFINWCKDLFGTRSIYTPNMDDVHSAVKKAEEDALRDKLPLKQKATIVGQLIGKCVIDDPKTFSESHLKGPISYDTFVLPSLIHDPVSIYKKEKENTVVVTQPASMHVADLKIPNLNAQTLIEIDALSRTIFAEMANCIPIGPQYAMAVARVIKNREKLVQRSRFKLEKEHEKNPKKVDLTKKTPEEIEFIWDKKAIHWPGKNYSTKVASSPVQFSGWNNYVIDSDKLKEARKTRTKQLVQNGFPHAKAKSQAREEIVENSDTLAFYKFNKSGILHTLCPPSRADEPYYGGKKPYPELLAIWQNTVKIATEAVLYPEQFAKKTDSLKDVLHYTSGRASFYNMCPYRDPVVDGKVLNSNRCLNLWIDPKRSPEYCKVNASATKAPEKTTDKPTDKPKVKSTKKTDAAIKETKRKPAQKATPLKTKKK